MREMVEVSLYEDGCYDIRDIDSHYATQMYYISKQDAKTGECKKGIAYACQKSKKHIYLKKLTEKMLADLTKEVSEAQKKKKRMEKICYEINRITHLTSV